MTSQTYGICPCDKFDSTTFSVGSLHISSKMHPNAVGMIKEVLKEFPQIKVIWTYGSDPDHNNKRCCDFMITIKGMKREDQVKLGNGIANYLSNNAKRLGVNGIIWNRRVKGFPHVDNPPFRGPYGVWRDYDGPSPHTDHVHVEVDSSDYNPPVVYPWYFVDKSKFDPSNKDPKLARVDAKTGDTEAWVKPGYKFRVVKFVNKWGRKWALTDKGNLYAAAYISKVK